MTVSDTHGGTAAPFEKADEKAVSVLVAEDDPMFRAMLTMWLGRWGYYPLITTTGTQAWEILEAPGAPKLAIFDWMMPGMDGPELCRRLRSRGASHYTYVLLLTAKTDKHDLVAGLQAGADDFLTKPFDANELQARLRAGRRILQLQENLIAAQEHLRFQATHDPLTGIWNRAGILDFLNRELSRISRVPHALSVMMADIDHFKGINDTYGHEIGDVVLCDVAKRLQGAVRAYDAAGRHGGEEFLIISPELDAKGLPNFAERLRTRIAGTPVFTSAGPIRVTVSIGASALNDNESGMITADALLRAADTALYKAKAEGRNCVRLAATRAAVPTLQTQAKTAGA